MLIVSSLAEGAEAEKLPVRITWGYTRPASSSDSVKLDAGPGMTIGPISGYRSAGGGDIHGIQFVLEIPQRAEPKLQRMEEIWADLLAAADADTARRLGHDAAMYPGEPRLYIRTNQEGTAASP